MNKILFSIVCPIYNSQIFLKNAIFSVIHQTYKCWELVLIDDGSTDGSGEICNFFSSNDKRIKVFHQPNQGQSIARLSGIKKCSGEYVLFLDSDDFFEPNALDVLNQELSNKVVDAILFNAKKKSDNKYENVYSLNEKETLISKEKMLSKCFCERTAGYFWTYCFKKEMFDLSDEIIEKYSRIKYSEDVYLIYQIVKNNINSLMVLPLMLYVYVTNNDSITHTQTVDKIRDRFDVFNSVYSDFCRTFKTKITNEVKTSIGWTYLSYLNRSAKEKDYFNFKNICTEIRKSYIYKKMSKFKKDKFNSLIHFLLKIRMYKKAYLIIRNH